MLTKRAGSAAVMILSAFVVGSLAAADAKSPAYHPQIDPQKFTTTVDHPYFPLVPGTTWKFVEHSREGVKDNEITVTHDTRVIMGVRCVVVHDVVRKQGVVEEDTFDWFAQASDGAVWYFGEDTKESGPHGKLSTEGSWEAGVGKAMPGIIMPAVPKQGQSYRQEYGPGVAEDMGQIEALHDSVSVPFGAYRDCIRTKEWSLLEAGTAMKWYAKGVGFVRERSAEKEVSELVSMTRP